jgi:hypothetical protein
MIGFIMSLFLTTLLYVIAPKLWCASLLHRVLSDYLPAALLARVLRRTRVHVLVLLKKCAVMSSLRIRLLGIKNKYDNENAKYVKTKAPSTTVTQHATQSHRK